MVKTENSSASWPNGPNTEKWDHGPHRKMDTYPAGMVAVQIDPGSVEPGQDVDDQESKGKSPPTGYVFYLYFEPDGDYKYIQHT